MALNPNAVAFSIVLAIPAPVFAQGGAIPPDARVAYLSVQRISTESAFGKAAQSRIAAFQQQRTNEIRSRQSALAATQQQLDRATVAEERAKLSAQIATERTEIERMTAQAQVDIQNLQREINTDLRPKVLAVINELLKGTHVEVVTNADTAVIWAAPGLDLTNAVIERLNATASVMAPAAPSDKVAAPAAPPAPSPAKPSAPVPSGGAR